jgi:hypothetical protein
MFMKRIFQTWVLLALTSVLVLNTACNTSRRMLGLEEGWELLSERKVNFVRDKDEVFVTSRTLFTAIRFKVEDKDVRINDLKVFFQNGDKLEPSLDDVISANQYSKIIELARDGRAIEKIQFKYRSTGSILNGRANVVVIGQRYNPGY